MKRALVSIEEELQERLAYLRSRGKLLKPSAWSSEPTTIWKCCGR